MSTTQEKIEEKQLKYNEFIMSLSECHKLERANETQNMWGKYARACLTQFNQVKCDKLKEVTELGIDIIALKDTQRLELEQQNSIRLRNINTNTKDSKVLINKVHNLDGSETSFYEDGTQDSTSPNKTKMEIFREEIIKAQPFFEGLTNEDQLLPNILDFVRLFPKRYNCVVETLNNNSDLDLPKNIPKLNEEVLNQHLQNYIIELAENPDAKVPEKKFYKNWLFYGFIVIVIILIILIIVILK
jgi:hypothetical protein